jgi:hypothetical protein
MMLWLLCADLHRLEIICGTEGNEDVCEQIFFLVARSGWSLTELSCKTVNLEDVFLELTTREEP